MPILNIVFQEKDKKNIVIQATKEMTVSELILKYYKTSCISDIDRMYKVFHFQGRQIRTDTYITLRDLGMQDYSAVNVTKIEPPPAPTYSRPDGPTYIRVDDQYGRPKYVKPSQPAYFPARDGLW